MAKTRKKAKPNGYIVWEGPSRHDKAPIAAVAVGFVHKSENPKTGPMIQVYSFRTDMAPGTAVKTGKDESVCNNCSLRPYLVRKLSREEGIPPRHRPPMCYVSPVTGLGAVYRAYKDGLYPPADARLLRRLLRGRRVRLGSYGNFSNLPPPVVKRIIQASAGWTLYEHDWRTWKAEYLKEFAMASVSSEEDKDVANELGWRTFRVKRPDDPVFPDEVVCPAAHEAGHKSNCFKCLLCQGTSKLAKNVVINDHGPTSAATLARIDAVLHHRRVGLVLVG